jgi:glycosyltransferase involved in cell wall biosynthesis
MKEVFLPAEEQHEAAHRAQKSSAMVSIIIPNYNHARFVSDAIQSIISQDYSNFEIIVVDDGSTDDSHAVIAKFGKRVQYIWQKNQGLSAARNTGIRTARGDFIGVLDADDMYEPGFMSSLVPVLVENPDAAGVYCGYQFVDHQNNPLPQRESRLIPDEQLYQALLDGNFLVPESLLVRRCCYDDVGLFDESFDACEDWEMWLRITKQYRVIGSSMVLTRHRILPGSMSTDPSRMLRNRISVLKKHFGLELMDGQKVDRIQRRVIGQAYLTSSVEYLQYQDIDNAYESFRKMAMTYPDSLKQLNTFYELGCGNQPKGYRGDFSTLDLQNNALVLLNMLGKLFSDQLMSDALRIYQRPAYANAYIALGLLSYGARQMREARSYLLRAIFTAPIYGLKAQFIAIWLKSLPGIRNLVKIYKGSK